MRSWSLLCNMFIKQVVTRHSCKVCFLKAYERLLRSALQWLKCNQMKVNPDKFQAIIFGNKHESNNAIFDVAVKHIPCHIPKCQASRYQHWQRIMFRQTRFFYYVPSSSTVNSLQRAAMFLTLKTRKLVFDHFVIWSVMHIKCQFLLHGLAE